MPPDSERLASLETAMKTVKEDVGEIKSDVKALLAFMHGTNARIGFLSVLSARVLAAIAIVVSAVGIALRFIH